ncbi:hypothetical protein LCGC14_2042510, partial [marine sediment metagenome]
MHEKLRDKVAIVGMHARTRDDAPYKDLDFEIWVSNEMPGYVSRFDVLFEVHDFREFQAKKRNTMHYDWMKENIKHPIYMSKVYDEIPMSIVYPYQEIIAEYGQYIVSTIVLQLLLAMYMKYNEIHIYGCELSTKEEEYSIQKACFEHHLGYALGLRKATGKPIIFIPKNSELLKSVHVYGRDGVSQLPYILMNAKQAAEKEQTKQIHEMMGMVGKAEYNRGRKDAIK